jgi:hypothetical protein
VLRGLAKPIVPSGDPGGREAGNIDLAEYRNDTCRGRRAIVAGPFAAAPFPGLEVILNRIGDNVGACLWLAQTGKLPSFLVEPCASARLRLRKTQDIEVVGVSNVVGAAKRLIVLAPVDPCSGNPRAAGAAPVANVSANKVRAGETMSAGRNACRAWGFGPSGPLPIPRMEIVRKGCRRILANDQGLKSAVLPVGLVFAKVRQSPRYRRLTGASQRDVKNVRGWQRRPILHRE